MDLSAAKRGWLSPETISLHVLMLIQRISGIPSLDLEFALKVKCQVKDHGCISCPGRLAVVCDNFGTRADVILERYPLLRPLTLSLTLKVKTKSKVMVVYSAQRG